MSGITTEASRRARVMFLFWALPTGLLMLTAGCTCPQEEEASGQVVQPWLRACFARPTESFRAFDALGGEPLLAFGPPSTIEGLLAEWAGRREADLVESVDLDEPLLALIMPPSSDAPLGRSVVLVGRRREGKAPVSRQKIRSAKGSLHVHRGRGFLAIARSPEALEAALPHAEVPCEDGETTPDLVVQVSKELLASKAAQNAVEKRGARLEASARQATARRGKATLGDPEVLARMLVQRARRTREAALAAAPLELEVDLNHRELEVRLHASGEDQGEQAPEQTPAEHFALLPPDAYFVLSNRTGPEQTERAGQAVEALARLAAGRMEEGERARLTDLATRFVKATSGWSTLALRPNHEPGPVLALALVDCRDPTEASEVLHSLAAELREGYLHEVLDHLGVAVSVESEEREGRGGFVRFKVAQPRWVTDQRGAGLRRILGERPTLAYRVREEKILWAFGLDPAREIARMEEGLAGNAGPSMLSQQIASSASEQPGSRFVLYAWLPALAALLTRGAPGAGLLAEGGASLVVTGPEKRPRINLHLDAAQLQSVLRFARPGSAR